MVGRPLFAGKVSTTSVAADDGATIRDMKRNRSEDEFCRSSADNGDMKKNRFEERIERSRRKLENFEVASAVGVAVEIRWKGPPRIVLSSFRKTVKRNCTKEESVKNGPNGAVLVEWDEEFQSLCNLSGYKDNVFHPWEIAFTVWNVCRLASVGCPFSLLKYLPLLPSFKRDIKVMSEGGKREATSSCPVSSTVRRNTTDGEYAYLFDSDSNDEYEEGESDEGKEDPAVRKSFSYGPLVYANCQEFLLFILVQGSTITCASDLVVLQNSKRSILPWRKRKLSFRSPKSKGEPLLKKDNGEEGGDDIDFDRRQLSSN
ncbi:hypothetical protein RND71_007133 [Anisodus tanguticus]|uniref:Uncharacterized protein n=1 Tax=Anisodus tanguticus TaxID=243964 RepID=A0AAE1SL87_9SOLA|nr:hypothetical protein RND71_007133 [Anisodus tanguticus]